MANWNRRKVIRLASGFAGRSKSCFGLALRKVHRAAQYAYRDRRVKKRLMRSNWIQSINAGVREHGITYSVFANALVKKSNIELDRKILGALAVTEPYSFKSVIDEVKVQAGIAEIARRKPLVAGMQSVSFPEAMKRGLIIERKRPEELKAVIFDEPQAELYGLRFPEKHSKKPDDFMRLSFKDEDEAFLEEQKLKTLTIKEQKKLPREVLTDNWQEDMSLYKNKRKP